MFKEQQQIANAEIYNLMISQQKTIEENRAKEKRVARELHDGVLGKIFGVEWIDTMNTAQDQHAIKSRLEYLAELKADWTRHIWEISMIWIEKTVLN